MDNGKAHQAELIKTVREDPERARNALMELVTLNMGYLHRMAASISGNMDHEDLVSEGISGLLEAVPSFDVSAGTAFLTYATPYIRKRMLQYVEHTSATRITRYTRERIDDDELRAARNALDLDAFRDTIADISSAQGNEAYFRIERTEMEDAVRAAIGRLPEREAAAVRSRYGIGGPRRSLGSLADEYGVSVRMVSKYLANGIRKLKEDSSLRAWSDAF